MNELDRINESERFIAAAERALGVTNEAQRQAKLAEHAEAYALKVEDEDRIVEAEGYGLRQNVERFEVTILRSATYSVQAVDADEALDAVLQGYVDEPFDDSVIDYEVEEV